MAIVAITGEDNAISSPLKSVSIDRKRPILHFENLFSQLKSIVINEIV